LPGHWPHCTYPKVRGERLGRYLIREPAGPSQALVHGSPRSSVGHGRSTGGEGTPSRARIAQEHLRYKSCATMGVELAYVPSGVLVEEVKTMAVVVFEFEERNTCGVKG